jgi:LppP/LprE lipoprotein
MGTSTRGVRGGRDRHSLPQRSPTARWTRRVFGVIATIALLGVAWAIYTMVRPASDDTSVAATPTATVAANTTDKHASSSKHHSKHKSKGPSKAAVASLHHAEDLLRTQGFTTTSTKGYDVKHTLRVLIARPVGEAKGASTAFFFEGGTLLGRDSTQPSSKLAVAKTSTTTATLAYGIYDGDDSPKSTAHVRFKLSGGAVTPEQTIPDYGDRVAGSG